MFSSHLDGSRHVLTPERCMDIQRSSDATITMVLDECPALPIGRDEAARIDAPHDALGRALS